jgi:GDPmannose 4,6-dehydratase
MKKKVALITGINGQDGSYLAEFLLGMDYEVWGTIKRNSVSENQTSRLEKIYPLIKNNLEYADLTDLASLLTVIKKSNPDEIYNLAAQSHVQVSFEIPEYTTNVNAMGVLNLLNIIKNYNKKKIKFYQASTSEMFGDQNRMPLNERSIMEPASPYGISKLYAYHLVKNYRESYNIFASNGILFNHESPLRGENFITRKITIGLSEIYHGLKNTLEIGNINSRRDWGHAKDYAEAIWKILQIKKPIDLIISTNKSYSVRDFIKLCFKYMKIQIKFIGKGINEKVIDNNGKVWIKINKKYIRPKDINHLMGDSSLARKLIKWKNKTSFKNLAEEMIKKDLKRAEVLKKIKSIE